jgi:hypothetical protein
MSTKSCEHLYGTTIRMSAERTKKARKEADRLACDAWNMRMLGYKGPAQPSPSLGDAINAGFGYLEVRCLGCDTNQTVALDIVRRSKHTPVHELERYMRCKDSAAILTSEARLSRCAGQRSRRAIHHRFGGRGKMKQADCYTAERRSVSRRNCVFWRKWRITLSPEELARIAPLDTVVIALGALGIATWSLLAQKASLGVEQQSISF